jgi:hypothetical protein
MIQENAFYLKVNQMLQITMKREITNQNEVKMTLQEQFFQKETKYSITRKYGITIRVTKQIIYRRKSITAGQMMLFRVTRWY